MSLPFTIDQFLDVFRRYNESIWPGQWALNLLAVVAVAAAVRGGRGASRAASGIVAALWMWTGLVYHVGFFRAINPAALLFGSAFFIEAALIVWFGVVRSTLRFEAGANGATLVGSVLIVYALVAYPLIGYALGHRYPSTPTFGVPCPMTIFTFGLVLLCPPPRPRTLIIIPVGWAVLGVMAALQLGMCEDIGLVIAAIVTSTIVVVQRPRPRDIVADRGAPIAATSSAVSR